MNPTELQYAASHEWVRIEGNVATVGITHFAQEQLGDLTFIELPQVGDQAQAGKEIGTVESVKAASEIYSPVDGEVVEINSDLESTPEKVNQDPFHTGWLFKVRLAGEVSGLMNADAYTDHCATAAH